MSEHNPLRILGLSKKEEKVLNALLSGLDTPVLISLKTDVSRPSVYDILQKFKKRGLITSHIEKGKKKWKMFGNDEIVTLLNEIKQTLFSVEGGYEEVYHSKDSKVNFYYGNESVKAKLFEIFAKHKNERWIGLQGENDIDGWSSIMSEEDTKKINQHIKDNKLIIQGVLSEGWVDFAFKKLGKVWAKGYGGRMAQIHYLPKKYFDHTGQIYVFKHVTYLLSLNQKILIEIREEGIARAIASLVQYATDNSEKVDVNKRVRDLLGEKEY